MKPLILSGFGTSVPAHFATQADAAVFARQLSVFDDDQLRRMNAIYRSSGVRRRHSVLLQEGSEPIADRQAFYPRAAAPDDRGPSTAERMREYDAAAAPLMLPAARAALEDAGVQAGDITHLITVSCSGFAAPGADMALIRNLMLPSTVARTHIGFMGCHGALNGLRVAHAFAAADPSARVLLCAVELCTLHLHYSQDADKLVANSLFADGAAAVVAYAAATGSAEEAAPPWRMLASGSVMIPDSADAMSWRIGNHGFEMTLAPRVPELIQRHLRDWLAAWLDGYGYAIRDIASWAVHPGGPRILSAVEAALELPAPALQPSREVLAEFGNMSSPTVLFILDRLRRGHQPRPCVVLGFGPGLVAEAALIV